MGPSADQVLFAYVVDRPESAVDLGVAALMVAEFEYTGLDIAHYVGILDDMAEQVRASCAPNSSPREAVSAISKYLFERVGFRGNTTNYYDARNNFLNEVIDRRLGVPITLAILYIEIGRRLGVELFGLNFPGHFLVRLEQDDEIVIVDPFHGGAVLSVEALGTRLKAVLGPNAELSAEHLLPATKHDIIARLLSNLAAIYRRADDVFRSIAVLERQSIVCPSQRVDNELAVLRDRAASLN